MRTPATESAGLHETPAAASGTPIDHNPCDEVLVVWSMPILIAAAMDFKQTRSVHPVYLIGLGVCVVRIFNVPLIASTGAWNGFAHWVFGVVASV